MSDYRITVWASTRRINSDAKETINLVNDWSIPEEQAAAYIADECGGDEEIDEMVAEHARNLIGYEFGACLPGEGGLR
jgi:hypothetical protein